MNKNFYPSINGIYFKNFDMFETNEGLKRIRGDLYMLLEDSETCIGYFNPSYQTEANSRPQYFLRLEENFQFLYETEKRYESFFNKNAVPLTEYDCPVGFTELIADLEIITYLYTFMNNIRPQNDFEALGLVGIINGAGDNPTIKVLQIKDAEMRTGQQIIEFIQDKVSSIQLDLSYPVRIFKRQDDFELLQRNGKMLDFIKLEDNQ